MPKQHAYVLGINAYDHDVSACLLRDGEIDRARAITLAKMVLSENARTLYGF